MVAGIVALALCAVVGYAAYVFIPPLLRGEGCRVEAGGGSVSLTVEQAENAALIAAVGRRMDMPRRAVTIALATAYQESKLRNLPYGDRDSVGMFQQRPSQGWGSQAQLLDPVSSTMRFYRALRDVSGYRDMPVHEAAQAVQRSADGDAYAVHKPMAGRLAAALTGATPSGLTCWGSTDQGEFQLRELRTQLTRQLGGNTPAQLTGSGVDLPVPGERAGWRLALWAVANAGDLGISTVGYGGMRWEAGEGQHGWQQADTPSDRVQIRGAA